MMRRFLWLALFVMGFPAFLAAQDFDTTGVDSADVFYYDADDDIFRVSKVTTAMLADSINFTKMGIKSGESNSWIWKGNTTNHSMYFIYNGQDTTALDTLGAFYPEEVHLYMVPGDTLDTGEQDEISSYAKKASRLTINNTNPYGSNAASATRKNWGALHIFDGASGTSGSCGISGTTQGDSSFFMHFEVEGDHSSGIKVGMAGTDDSNHRGINVLMPVNGTDDSQTGVLVRDMGSVGYPLTITKWGEGIGAYIHCDSASSPVGSGVPLHVYSEHDSSVAIFRSIESDPTTNQKQVVQIIADSVHDAGAVTGLKIGGTDFNAVTDAHIMLETSDGSYWAVAASPVDFELKFYFKKAGGSVSLRGSLDTLGNWTDDYAE